MVNSDKPKLVEYKVAKADLNEKGENYIIELLSNNSFIKINRKTKDFIDEIDGIKNYKEITTIINEKFKMKLTENQVRDIILNKLGKFGIVKGIESDRNRNTRSRLWFHWSLMDGKCFEILAKRFTFLFNPFMIKLLIAFEFLVFIVLLSNSNLNVVIHKKNIFFFSGINFFIIFIMLLLTSIFHEFGHIVASFRYSAKPRKVGVGLYLFMPVFFVDLSESWLLDRKKRCVIDLGGIYFQLLSIIIYFPMIFINNSIFNITNYKIIMYATLTNILFNLNPTLRMDGYWALSDLTGVVNIHLRIRKNAYNRIKRIFNIGIVDNENYELTEVAKKIFAVWSLTYIGITVLFVYIAINKFMFLLSNDEAKLCKLCIYSIGYFILRILIAILRGKFEV